MNAIQSLIDSPIENYPLATVACFDPTAGELPRRTLDEAKTQEFLHRLEMAGAEAVLIGASTGQGHLRTPSELERWFACAGQTDSSSPPSGEAQQAMRMGLLRPEDGLSANTRLAECLRDYGYAVGFVRPGNDLGPNPSAEEIAINLAPTVQAIAECGLAVGLYSIPDVSGYAMPVESVVRLLDNSYGDSIVAVKVTEADYESSTLQFLAEPKLKRLKIVQGWDPHLARALADGGNQVGVTSGPMSFAVFQYLHLLEAARTGDASEAEASQLAVTALFQSMQDDPTKFANLQIAKRLMGLGHPLVDTVNDQAVEKLLDALRSLPRAADRKRLASSLDLMQNGPWHEELAKLARD